MNKLSIQQQRMFEANASQGDWYWWQSEEPPLHIGNKENARIGVRADNGYNAVFVCEARNNYKRLLDIAEAAKRGDTERLTELLEHVEI